MKRAIRFVSVTAGALILWSAAFVFSADRMSMSMPMGDSAGARPAGAAEVVSDSAGLKPQSTCPILGNPIDKKLFFDYNGKRIYVCCEGCVAQVKKDPQRAIAKLASMGQGVETIAAKAPQK